MPGLGIKPDSYLIKVNRLQHSQLAKGYMYKCRVSKDHGYRLRVIVELEIAEE